MHDDGSQVHSGTTTAVGGRRGVRSGPQGHNDGGDVVALPPVHRLLPPVRRLARGPQLQIESKACMKAVHHMLASTAGTKRGEPGVDLQSPWAPPWRS